MEWLGNALQWVWDLLVQQGEVFLRLCLAAALGGLIGLEREASGKPAGFRTNLLICLGAALLTELSRFVALEPGSANQFRADPGRIAAQIVSGMGFLGAGTIMKARGAVTGLTTAATLWVVAAIGMAVGAGAYVPALLATTIVMFALFLLYRVEEQLLKARPQDRTLEITLGVHDLDLTKLEAAIRAARLQVISVNVTRHDDSALAAFQLRGPDDRYPALVQALLGGRGVHRVALL
ncbi:MAG: MgtC/SapB family protein [Gemmatimonadetes bacterium]|nr:MgtC/SapB family protein [Gemmatimonadota bacterium]